MKIIEQIKNFIRTHALLPKDCTLVLGLSGGPDSVFLLHMLAELKQEGYIKKIIAAHLDHEWRKDSASDAQFCIDIAKKHGVDCVSRKIAELGLKLKFDGSKEELGRKARRYFFTQIKQAYNADLIALAHHAQDQQETFFIRLIRGTSLSGLTAMSPKHGDYIRPLLETNKQDIINFLDAHKIPYLTDPTNISQEFLRNRIRSQVIPALKKCDARFEQNFKTTMQRLQNTEQFLEQLTQEYFAEISRIEKEIYYVNINQLLSLHPVMQYKILVYWLITQHVPFPVSERFLKEMIKFLQQPGSKTHQIHHNWVLVKKKDIAYIQKKAHD